MVIEFQRKSIQVSRHLRKFNKPLVMWKSLRGCHLRRYCKFDNFGAWEFLKGALHGILHFFADDMLAECRNKVLDSPGNENPIRILRDEFHRITNGIAPQTSVAVNDHCVVLIQFYFFDIET